MDKDGKNRDRNIPRNDILLFAVAAVVLTGVCIPVIAPMIGWMAVDFNYSQNLMFPFIAVALLWLNRKELGSERRHRAAAGAALAAVAILLYVYGWHAGKYATMRYSYAAALIGSAWWIFGHKVMRRAWAPAALILLTVPFHKKVVAKVIVPFTYWDRYVTGRVSVRLLNVVGIPAWREGFNLYLPGGRLSLDITCSGVNYILCLTVITIAIIYMSRGALWRKLILAAAAPVIGMAANIARVTANMAVANSLGATAGYSFFHDFSGVVFSLVALAGMLCAAKALGLKYRQPVCGEPAERRLCPE